MCLDVLSFCYYYLRDINLNFTVLTVLRFSCVSLCLVHEGVCVLCSVSFSVCFSYSFRLSELYLFVLVYMGIVTSIKR